MGVQSVIVVHLMIELRRQQNPRYYRERVHIVVICSTSASFGFSVDFTVNLVIWFEGLCSFEECFTIASATEIL